MRDALFEMSRLSPQPDSNPASMSSFGSTAQWTSRTSTVTLVPPRLLLGRRPVDAPPGRTPVGGGGPSEGCEGGLGPEGHQPGRDHFDHGPQHGVGRPVEVPGVRPHLPPWACVYFAFLVHRASREAEPLRRASGARPHAEDGLWERRRHGRPLRRLFHHPRRSLPFLVALAFFSESSAPPSASNLLFHVEVTSSAHSSTSLVRSGLMP